MTSDPPKPPGQPPEDPDPDAPVPIEDPPGPIPVPRDPPPEPLRAGSVTSWALEHGGVAAGSCADCLRGAAHRAPPRASSAATAGFSAGQGVCGPPAPPTSRGSQSGATISAAAWNDIEQRTLILRRSMRITGGKITILSLLLNPEDRQCDFRLPPPCLSSRVLLDSAEADAWERPLAADSVNVAAYSAVLLCFEYAG